MTTISPWINFNGNAEEAFTFYQSVFGGEFLQITRFKDVASPEFQVAEEDAEKIMNISLRIGDGQFLVGNDVPAFMGTVNVEENRSKIYVRVDSREEAEEIFAGLSVEAAVEVPIVAGEEGACFGMFRDQYGIEWIIEFSPNV